MLSLLLTLAACNGDRPSFRGEGCELNTECDAPLVCGFRRCREQCRTEADCGLRLGCFLDTRTGLGYCQLPDELTCLRDSDCEEACGGDAECADRLACRDGECGQECADERDCVAGSTCEVDMATGAHTCSPGDREHCIYNSDCAMADQICDPRQFCRLECDPDQPDLTRDCDAPRSCARVIIDGVEMPRCVLPDGGV